MLFRSGRYCEFTKGGYLGIKTCKGKPISEIEKLNNEQGDDSKIRQPVCNIDKEKLGEIFKNQTKKKLKNELTEEFGGNQKNMLHDYCVKYATNDQKECCDNYTVKGKDEDKFIENLYKILECQKDKAKRILCN